MFDVVVIADFDRDGRPDVAFGGCSKIQIRLTGPGGTPGRAVVFAVDNPLCATLGMVSGDFNRDGIADLAVRIETTTMGQRSDFAVWLGKGDATFRPLPIATLPGSVPLPGLLVGDFDGDGVSDLLVETVGSQLPSFSLWRGRGDGTLEQKGRPLPLPSVFGGATLGDVNRDGHLDLLGVQSSPADIAAYLGDGAGNFGPGPATFAPGDLADPVLADFDKDGVLDLALTDSAASFKVGLARGRGDGGFMPPLLFPLGDLPSDSMGPLRVADFDGDGRPDVIGSSFNSSRPERGIRIFYGAPGFGLVGPEKVDDFMGPAVLEVADFNQDGRPDLLLSDPLGIYLNLGP